uniref:Uncharacterized protein n=1 Tax=Branchiostoma floridae TaxID=7739 RepID=C3ZM01_BRAFL|eukprot:XP_002590471.1 hypothetical protein BRAFLDRAFT_86312 [Branchiostoma floridae]
MMDDHSQALFSNERPGSGSYRASEPSLLTHTVRDPFRYRRNFTRRVSGEAAKARPLTMESADTAWLRLVLAVTLLSTCPAQEVSPDSEVPNFQAGQFVRYGPLLLSLFGKDAPVSEVYDQSGDSPLLIYSYCRDARTEWRTVLSSSSSVEVVYRSRCAWSKSGFFFSFRETECVRSQTTTCGPRVNLDASCGTIFSPTNSSATTCEWLVTSPLGQSILMFFQPIRLRSDGDVDDYVTILEGAKNGGFQTTNELTENYDIFPYLSTTNQVLIKLSKGQNGTETRFVAHYWMEEEATFVKHMEDVYLSEELCEPGFTHYRGNCYQVLASQVPLWWESAQQRCSDMGATLASITSPYEMKFIERLARESLIAGGSAPITAFIGLRSKGTSGTYAWVDGSDVTFTRWQGRPPEPTGQGKAARTCTLMTTGRQEGDMDTRWYPVPCDYPRAGRNFICKAGARAKTCPVVCSCLEDTVSCVQKGLEQLPDMIHKTTRKLEGMSVQYQVDDEEFLSYPGTSCCVGKYNGCNSASLIEPCTVEGFGDSGCGGYRNLLSDCGVLQTVGFPGYDYPNNSLCEWHIHVSPRHRIILSIDVFDMEESDTLDKLPACTSSTGGSDVGKVNFDDAIIRQNLPGRGSPISYGLNYRHISDCQDFSHLLIENSTISVTEKCGSFRQAPQQASTNLDYHIMIESKSGSNLKLDFSPISAMQDVQFVCKGMKDLCEEDLQVYDQSGDSPLLIYSYCRDARTEWRTVLSSSSSVEVVYRSRCAWSKSGFFFSFRETECVRSQTTTCGPRVNLDASCGTIFSPTNSSATTCEWLVTSPLGQSILMFFQPIRLRSDGDVDDYVTILEGAKNGGFQTTNELTENYDIFPYLSTTNQVLIKLSKGQNGTETRFVAHYWMEEEATFVKHMEDVYLSEELCEPGFTHYRGNCYQVLASQVPLWWESAQQRCSDMGATLASITSPYEMKFIERLARESLIAGGSTPITAFIGLRSKGTSGTYAWVDGSDVTFTRWQGRPPEPTGQGKAARTCTLMTTGRQEGDMDTRWYPVPCDYPRAGRNFICKAGARAKTCPVVCSCLEDTVSCVQKGLEQLPDMIHKTTRKLDLSNNSIQQLPENAFGTLHTLLLLNLSGNLITALRSSSFSGLEKLQVFVADDDIICCLAPRVNVCTAEKDPTSTCDHLIASNVLRITTWVLGLLSILGNPTVVLQHLRTKHGGTWTAFLCNLAVADFCTGLYLLVIGSADAFFRGEYIFYADHWISSTMCASAAVVFTFSKMSSLFLVGAIMLENHVFPRLPIKYLTNRMHSPSIVASVCWTLSFCCTITLTISSQLTGYFIGSRTGLCTPVLTTVLSSAEPGWKYVFFVYTILPATIMVLTTVSSIIAFYAGKPNPLANDLYFSKDSAKEKKLRLGLKGLLVLNYLCWTVVVITGILTRVGEKISPDLAVWTALFLMTISAGIDPFIHLASLADFSSDKREATNCAEANGNIVNTFVDSLGRRVYKASTGTLRSNGSDQTEEKQAIKAYLQCLSVDVETNFVVKLILQFRSYSTVLVEGSATQEMSVLRRIGESGGHQNIVRQCVIPELDAYKWVLYTVYENCKLKEVIPTLSSEDLLTISLDMSKALHFLHQENIALGKLTLDGVLVEKLPHIKVVIADFTSAKIVGTGETAQKSFQADFDEWQRLRTMIIRKSAYATLSCRL